MRPIRSLSPKANAKGKVNSCSVFIVVEEYKSKGRIGEDVVDSVFIEGIRGIMRAR